MTWTKETSKINVRGGDGVDAPVIVLEGSLTLTDNNAGLNHVVGLG